MASERQIAANRKNALKSTGPRSAAGKARAANNSKKHGLASVLGAAAFAAADRLGAAIFREQVGLSQGAARRAAVATFEVKRTQKMRAVAIEAAMLTDDHPMSIEGLAELLFKLKAAERYEERAISKKKRALRGA